MNEEEKQAVEDSKDILKELNKHKDKDFIGRLYYKNKPIENILQILLNLIEKQQKEIERKDKVFDDCKYTVVEYVKTAKDTMQKMEEMIEIEKNVINGFDRLLKGE